MSHHFIGTNNIRLEEKPEDRKKEGKKKPTESRRRTLQIIKNKLVKTLNCLNIIIFLYFN